MGKAESEIFRIRKSYRAGKEITPAKRKTLASYPHLTQEDRDFLAGRGVTQSVPRQERLPVPAQAPTPFSTVAPTPDPLAGLPDIAEGLDVSDVDMPDAPVETADETAAGKEPVSVDESEAEREARFRAAEVNADWAINELKKLHRGFAAIGMPSLTDGMFTFLRPGFVAFAFENEGPAKLMNLPANHPKAVVFGVTGLTVAEWLFIRLKMKPEKEQEKPATKQEEKPAVAKKPEPMAAPAAKKPKAPVEPPNTLSNQVDLASW